MARALALLGSGHGCAEAAMKHRERLAEAALGLVEERCFPGFAAFLYDFWFFLRVFWGFCYIFLGFLSKSKFLGGA